MSQKINNFELIPITTTDLNQTPTTHFSICRLHVKVCMKCRRVFTAIVWRKPHDTSKIWTFEGKMISFQDGKTTKTFQLPTKTAIWSLGLEGRCIGFNNPTIPNKAESEHYCEIPAVKPAPEPTPLTGPKPYLLVPSESSAFSAYKLSDEQEGKDKGEDRK